MEADREEIVLLLLREGCRGDAVKLYQEETGANTEDAHDAISYLATRHGLHDRLPLLPIAMLVIALIGGVVAAMAG
jgi:hypothetical protein